MMSLSLQFHVFFILLSLLSSQIGELKPATSYVFLVRAENVHGLSVPSPLSNVVKTLGIGSGHVPQTALAAARIVLSGKVSLIIIILALREHTNKNLAKPVWDRANRLYSMHVGSNTGAYSCCHYSLSQSELG